MMIETENSIEYVKSLASTFYSNDNMAAAISSGSFRTDGMVVIPCSMKTLSSIANGYDDNLISRRRRMYKRIAEISYCTTGNTSFKNSS